MPVASCVRPSLSCSLAPQIEGILRDVAEIFDNSFWPPGPLDVDVAQIIALQVVNARAEGSDISGLVNISARFGLEL